jgi:putative transposase
VRRGKKAVGRKRFVAVDSLGLIWAVSVLTADVQDWDGGRWLLAAARRNLPRVREVIADRGFSRRFVEFVRRVLGWRVTTTTARPAGGFAVEPRRWVVERTFAWLVGYRRLRVEYEYHTETSEAVILVAMTDLMLRRLHPAR